MTLLLDVRREEARVEIFATPVLGSGHLLNPIFKNCLSLKQKRRAFPDAIVTDETSRPIHFYVNCAHQSGSAVPFCRRFFKASKAHAPRQFRHGFHALRRECAKMRICPLKHTIDLTFFSQFDCNVCVVKGVDPGAGAPPGFARNSGARHIQDCSHGSQHPAG